MRKIICSVLLLHCLTCTFAQQSYGYKVPKEIADGWKTAHLNEVGVDSSRIYQLFNQLGPAKHKIHSVLLVKNANLVLEEYFGKNEIDTPHDLRSATKSIISILLGIAIDKEFIEDIDDPVSKYLGNLKARKNLDPRKADITIRHLITMSSGLDCDDWDRQSTGQEDKVYRKKDWLQYTLDLPMINEPGKKTYYCSMGVVLAAEIISRASGERLDEFAENYLFQPLGITNYRWGHTTTGRPIIPSAKRLYMTPRDLAKIGLLVSNKGVWQGKQIVSEAWLSQATSKHARLASLDYGFLWWRIPFKLGSGTTTAIAATGNGGQYIFILEPLNAIAIFTGGAYNSEDAKIPFAIVNDVIIPAAQTKEK